MVLTSLFGFLQMSGCLAVQFCVISALLPGDLESVPVLINSGHDKCFYEFQWHTAAACVLSQTKGDDCRVSDSQAGNYLVH